MERNTSRACHGQEIKLINTGEQETIQMRLASSQPQTHDLRVYNSKPTLHPCSGPERSGRHVRAKRQGEEKQDSQWHLLTKCRRDTKGKVGWHRPWQAALLDAMPPVDVIAIQPCRIPRGRPHWIATPFLLAGAACLWVCSDCCCDSRI